MLELVWLDPEPWQDKKNHSHAQEEGPRQANSHLEVEEEDIGKTLSVKDGKLGFVMAKGFIEKTNFIVAIKSQVCSIKYTIKGWLLYYTNFHISIWKCSYWALLKSLFVFKSILNRTYLSCYNFCSVLVKEMN